MRSIQRYLGIGLVSVVALGMLVGLVITYLIVIHEVEERFDAQMAQTARLIDALVSSPDSEGGFRRLDGELLSRAAGEDGGHPYETKLAFQLVDAEGRIAFRTDSAPEQLLASLGRGYSEQRHGDATWRVFQLHDAQRGFSVLVGERTDVRGEIADYMAKLAVAANAVGLPLLILMIWLVLRRGLAPLMRIAQAIAGRKPNRLEPIATQGLPRELTGIVDSLNRLLARLSAALTREKRFTADAAHELRTPLAVLRVHAQNAANARDDAARTQSLNQLVRAVDRATHLVEQLLTLARLEPGSVEPARRSIDLTRLLRDEVAQLVPLALRKQQELSLDGAGQAAWIGADEVALSVLVRNLIDNAIRYSPIGGEIGVSLSGEDGRVILQVRDNGPGVPAELRERIFERFYQQAPGKGQGAGLGLSIVSRIAELYGAELRAEDAPGGGLCVSVTFPAVEAPAG